MFIKPNIEKIKNAGNTAKLVKLLRSRRAITRIESLVALNEIAGDNSEILEKMRRTVTDRDLRVRGRAAMIFARKGDPGVLDQLAEIVSRGTENEKIEVLRILPHYYTKENEKITQILALALRDKKTSVQVESIKSIGEMEIETMAYYLIEFANHSISRFRFETVLALGRVKNPIGIDVLIGALTDSSPEVRKIAEDALRKVGTERALNALRDAPLMLMVKNMNESVSKRLTTVINIGKQRKEDGLPLIHKACFDDFKNIRIEAIKSIMLLKNNSSISTLIELLSDKYYDVRIEAIRALSRFNSMTALNALKGARNDPNTNVKLEAKKAYAALSSRMNVFDSGES